MKYLKANFEGIAEHLRKDWDWIHGNVGYEGSGKSTLSFTICKIIDPDFSEKNIVFTYNGFVEIVHKAKPYTAICCDEGVELFFNLNTNTRESKTITKLLTEIRSKNLFIIINIPDFSLLTKYIKNHRLKSLTRVISRGKCEFYSKHALSKIRLDHNTKRVFWPLPNFHDDFPKIKGKEWEAYLKKKKGFQQSESTRKTIREKLKRQKKLRDTFTCREASTILGINIQTLKKYMRDGLAGKKIFRKQDVFKDILGRFRIKKGGLKLAEKKILKIKNSKSMLNRNI